MQSQDPYLRESAFRVFVGSSMLVMDLQTDALLRVLMGGLEDLESINVSGFILFSRSYLTVIRSMYLSLPGPPLSLALFSILLILIRPPPTHPLPTRCSAYQLLRGRQTKHSRSLSGHYRRTSPQTPGFNW